MLFSHGLKQTGSIYDYRMAHELKQGQIRLVIRVRKTILRGTAMLAAKSLRQLPLPFSVRLRQYTLTSKTPVLHGKFRCNEGIHMSASANM
jgi:hypothetical protein